MMEGNDLYLFAGSVKVKWGVHPTVVDVGGCDGLYVESVEVLHWWAYPLMWLYSLWKEVRDFIQYFADLETRRTYK